MNTFAIRIALFVGLTIVGFGRPAPNVPAAVKGFTVTVEWGLGGLSRVRDPYPLTLTVDNQSGQPFDGHLRIEYDDGFLKTARFEPISISNSSKKRYRFCLDRNWNRDVRLGLVADGTTFWEMEPGTFHTPTNIEFGEETATFRVLTVTPDAKLLFGPLTFGGLASPETTDERLPGRLAHAVCGRAQAYQLPDQDPPLYSFGAIIFGNNAKVSQLNATQVSALARYVAGGGSVFLATEHTTFKKRLLERMPWPVDATPKKVSPVLAYHRIGIGHLYVYEGFPLTQQTAVAGRIGATTVGYDGAKIAQAVEGPEPRKSILLALDQLPEIMFADTMDPIRHYRQHLRTPATRGWSSVLVLVALFGFYTLLTGPATFIFRKDRRKLAIYMTVVVAGFILLSVIAGAFLRFRKGDGRWTTVTELTSDGAIQFIGLSVKSCAGQKHRLSFRSPNVETWALNHRGSSSYHYDFHGERRHWSLRQRRPSRPEDPDAPVDVPLAPWGSDALMGRTYLQDMKAVPFSLNLVGDATVGNSLGNLKVVAEGRVKNSLEVPLLDAELVFMIYTAHTNLDPRYGSSTEPVINRTAYISHGLGTLAPGEERNYRKQLVYNASDTRRASSRHREKRAGTPLTAGGAIMFIPKLASTKHVQLVLVARVKEPPAPLLGTSDFVFSKGTHFIIQRLPLDEQPPADGKRVEAKDFLKAVPATKLDSLR